MRILALILTLALAFVCCQALAGPAGPEGLRSRDLATETPRLLMPEQAGAERAVRRVRAPLTDPQLLAARIMAAAFVAISRGAMGLARWRSPGLAERSMTGSYPSSSPGP
jgi:hypothetical protein